MENDSGNNKEAPKPNFAPKTEEDKNENTITFSCKKDGEKEAEKENKINDFTNDKNQKKEGSKSDLNNVTDCPTPANIETYGKNYSDEGLFSKLKDSAKKGGAKCIYCVLLLYYMLDSPTIGAWDKAIIYGALGYFILPIDIIPDFIPVLGFTDDIAVLLWALHRVSSNVNEELKEKAKEKLRGWFDNIDEEELDNVI